MIVITVPEETLTLVTPSTHDKNEWLLAIQNAVKAKLNKSLACNVRTATYTFTKPTATYKDATYTGTTLFLSFSNLIKFLFNYLFSSQEKVHIV